MAKKTVNIGTSANKGNGDPLRTAFGKINDNFDEIYGAIGTDGTIFNPLSVDQSLVPTTTNTVDLGSASKQWRSLYVSNNTIYIGGVAIGVDGNGNLTTGGTVVGSTPAWANITGKPTFATVATSGAYADLSEKPTIPTLTSISSNIIPDDTYTRYFGSNAKRWAQIYTLNVDMMGSLTVGGDAGSAGLLLQSNGAAYVPSWTSDIKVNKIQNENDIQIEINLTDSTKRIWRFGEDGDLTLPAGGDILDSTGTSVLGGALPAPANGDNVSGNANILFYAGDWYNTSRLTINPATSMLTINGDNGEGGITLPRGGIIESYLQSELTMTVIPGTGSNSSGNLGHGVDQSPASQWSDNAAYPPGTLCRLTLVGATGDWVQYNNVTLYTRNNNGTNIVLCPDSSLVNTIDVVTGTFVSGTLTLLSDSVAIQSNSSAWKFGTAGDLTLPLGGTITEGGGISGAIRLTPAGGANANQALLIYPTAGGDGDHIHLTAGGGSTELYLGSDNQYVKLVNNGNLEVRANDGAVNRVYNWVGQGGWNSPPYTNRATTGGTGTGLRVNVTTANGGYTDITAITIHTAGTGYTDGDVITITNENNLTSTFQIGIAANNWTFGTDGTLASNEFKIKTLDGIPNSIGTKSNDTQFWDLNYGSNLATTGGTGTGLFVNVSDGGSGYASISINVAGTGYSPGDVITVTNGPFNGAPYASSATFIIGVSGTRSWTFDRYGALTLPSGNGSSVIQSVQQNNYQSKVTVSPFQILSQARTNQTQSYSAANGDFTSAASNGNGMIAFVSPTGAIAEFFTDTFDYSGAYERTVRLNGAGPEYEYSSFNGTDDELFLATAAPAGAVTSIRFSYTRISKIDINPDEGVFRIESEPTQDIDIQSGRELRLIATDRVDIDTGTNMRLRAGDGSVQIITNYLVPEATTHQWEFANSGRLTLPNNTTLKDTVGNAIAFGYEAGLNSQSAAAIAIGTEAGYTSQGANAVAVGAYAGGVEQGANSIAIGRQAGETAQAANSIILNATGATLDQTTANTFTVAPIRNAGGTSGVLQYNATTKEVTYSSDIQSENAVNIDINLSDSTLRRWRFGEDGELTFPDGTNQSTAWTGSLSSLETTHTVNLASSPSASGDGSVITVADNTATTKILLNNSLGVLGRATLPTLTTWGKIVIMVSQSTFASDVDFRLSDNSYANLTTVIPTTSSYGLNPQNGIKIAMSMAQFGWRLI